MKTISIDSFLKEKPHGYATFKIMYYVIYSKRRRVFKNYMIKQTVKDDYFAFKNTLLF